MSLLLFPRTTRPGSVSDVALDGRLITMGTGLHVWTVDDRRTPPPDEIVNTERKINNKIFCEIITT